MRGGSVIGIDLSRTVLLLMQGSQQQGRLPYDYHMVMARTQTIVQLTEELVAALDAEAARRGVSRSALIREAVVTLLADRREEAVTRSIVDGYTRVPPANPDEWGDLEAQSERATLEVLWRLDAEEREAGFEGW